MWEDIKGWFKKSETIFWARLQMVVGAIAAVWSQLSDPLDTLIGYVNSVPALQQFIEKAVSAKALPLYLLALGVITEYLRRRRDPKLGKES
jgi:hypothetical protein